MIRDATQTTQQALRHRWQSMNKLLLSGSCVLALGVMLSGCSKINAMAEFDPGRVTALEARIARGEDQVSMLQDRIKALDADRGDWILWRTIFSAPTPGVFAVRPPMPFAISAFSHHTECTGQAKNWATRETPAKDIGFSEPFVATFSNGTQKMFQCFPKGIRPGFEIQ